MTEGSEQRTGSCRCGKVRLRISGKPIFRAYCHCLICQEYNQSDYADITVFYRKDVVVQDESTVAYRVHQQPPLLKRGTCTSCGRPAVEKLSIPLMPAMTVVPSYNIANQAMLPAPKMHIFYHRRKADAVDTLPKYSSFLSSQSYFGIAVSLAMLRGGKG